MATKSAVKGSDFCSASERLELAIGGVKTITDGGIDDVEMPLEFLFELLRALAIDDLQYHQVIEASFERLSAFREAPIKWTHGRGMSGLTSHPGAVPAHVWSSAHEAAAAVVDMALGTFFRPLGIEPTATDPVVRFPDFEDITDERRETLGRLLSERGRKALAMTAEEVAEWTERIRHERAKLLQSCDDVSPTGEVRDKPKKQDAVARKLLEGWHDITEALDMKYVDRNKIKSLNERTGGPITNEGSGTRPRVYRDQLIKWWNAQDVRQQELANQREGRRLTAESQHAFGREATVVPEIGGSVKRRRRPKRT